MAGCRALTRSITHGGVERRADNADIKRVSRLGQTFKVWEMSFHIQSQTHSIDPFHWHNGSIPKVLMPEKPKSVPHLFSNSSKSAADHVLSPWSCPACAEASGAEADSIVASRVSFMVDPTACTWK